MATPVPVLLEAGQSNAESQGAFLSTLPVNLQTPDSGIKIWDGDSWETLQNGVNSNVLSAVDEHWGAGAEFSRLWRLDHPGHTLYIVKFGVGASTLSISGVNWNPTLDWGEGITDNYFSVMEDHIAAATAALVAADKTPVFQGLLWMQGESDADRSEEEALAYQTNLALFIAAARARWAGTPSLRIIIGRISDAASWEHRAIVRQKQADYVATDPRSVLIDTDSYPFHDTIHYNATGMVSMGADMYAAWETLRANKFTCRFV